MNHNKQTNSLNLCIRNALEQAEKATAVGEVPVVVLLLMLPKLYQAHITLKSLLMICGHAGILQLGKQPNLGELAPQGLSNVCDIEPCTMCKGALVHSRISDLVFGAYDLKAEPSPWAKSSSESKA